MVKYAGHNWYYTLVENEKKTGLLDHHDRQELRRKFTVAGFNSDGFRIFGVFDSFIDFIMLSNKLPEHEKCFFEVIFGEFPCKPFFDIDMPRNPDIDDEYAIKYIERFILNVCQTFKRLFKIDLNIAHDIRLYTSHGPAKYSFHVVITNYCLANHIQVAELCKKVIDISDDEDKPYIDSGIYTEIRQFRLVGSRKKGTDRVKIPARQITLANQTYLLQSNEIIESDTHQISVDMQESLVNFTLDCALLPPLVLPKETRSVPDIDDEFAQKALDICKEYFDFEWDSPEAPFVFRKVKRDCIYLDRRKTTYCNLCKKEHENENPFLRVINSGVYFCCRRVRGNQEFMGYILTPPTKTSSKTNKIELLKKCSEEPRPVHRRKPVSNNDKNTMYTLKNIKWNQPDLNKTFQIFY
jgi:hypothetical protein